MEMIRLSEVPLTESPAKNFLPSPSNDPLPSGRIKKLEGRVARLKEENRVLKKLKSVHSTDDAHEPVREKEKSSEQGRKIADINANHADVEEVLEVVKAAKLMTEVVTTAGATKNDVIEQVKRNERLNDAVMKYQTLKRKPLTQAQARRNMIVYLKNMAGFKMDYFNGITYDEIRPLFEKHYNYNQNFPDERRSRVSLKNYERYGLAKVKRWKLIESCGVHCINFLTTHIFLLVERMYPLAHFTLEQMLNDVRLQVKDESKMSLELLRLVERQLNEGLTITLNMLERSTHIKGSTLIIKLLTILGGCGCFDGEPKETLAIEHQKDAAVQGSHPSSPPTKPEPQAEQVKAEARLAESLPDFMAICVKFTTSVY
nr:hypothetical protein CTI12_AA167450 [Tanacetum cinerariifolium]